jgi:hypothetical protein
VRRIVLLLAVFLAGVASAASAQAGARVEVRVDGATRDPIIQVRNLLDEATWRDALADAFPIALHWTVELWRPRGLWVPTAERRFEFDVVIRREPLLGQYTLLTRQGTRTLPEQRFTDLRTLSLAVEQALRVPAITPRRTGEWWYTVSLRITTLNDEELAELERFSGRSGGGTTGDALTRAMVKLVGLPTQTLEARSDRFQVP